MQLADWQPIHGTKIDWGTLPAWAGAILTGGSLLLGFYILLRDRRKEESAQARSIATAAVRTSHDDPFGRRKAGFSHYRLDIVNSSHGVIWNPSVVAVPKTRRKLNRMTKGNFAAAAARVWEINEANQDDNEFFRQYNKGKLRTLEVRDPLAFFDPDGELQAARIKPDDHTNITLTMWFSDDWYDLYFTFTDAAGRSWRKALGRREPVTKFQRRKFWLRRHQKGFVTV